MDEGRGERVTQGGVPSLRAAQDPLWHPREGFCLSLSQSKNWLCSCCRVRILARLVLSRECESESEERFGRVALSRALSAPRFTTAAPVEVLNDVQKWSDSAFFGNAHLLVHHYFSSREGGHHWTNCIGEGSNAALKAQRTGVKGTDGINTMVRTHVHLRG